MKMPLPSDFDYRDVIITSIVFAFVFAMSVATFGLFWGSIISGTMFVIFIYDEYRSNIVNFIIKIYRKIFRKKNKESEH